MQITVSYNDTVLDCFHEVKQLLHEEKPLGFWETVLSKHRHAAKPAQSAPSCKVWCKTANNISVLPAPVTAHTKRFSLIFAVSQSSTEIACCPFVNCPDHSKRQFLSYWAFLVNDKIFDKKSHGLIECTHDSSIHLSPVCFLFGYDFPHR